MRIVSQYRPYKVVKKMLSLEGPRFKKIDRFYAVDIQIREIQLLNFIEKFLPMQGFEPGTSPVPSWYATNWAILAWIIWKSGSRNPTYIWKRLRQNPLVSVTMENLLYVHCLGRHKRGFERLFFGTFSWQLNFIWELKNYFRLTFRYLILYWLQMSSS